MSGERAATSSRRVPALAALALAGMTFGGAGAQPAGGTQRGGATAPAASAPSAATAARPRPAPGQPVTWVHVAPIFATRCAKCHTDRGGLMGPAPEGYRLTSYEAALSSADRVRVVAGQPHASELLRRVHGLSRPRMPLDGPPWLSQEELRLVDAWIGQGARNAEGVPAPVPVGAAVRLRGTLGPGWTLDGLALSIGARTRIDKSPAPGDLVEVRGRIGANGAVEVERLRRR